MMMRYSIAVQLVSLVAHLQSSWPPAVKPVSTSKPQINFTPIYDVARPSVFVTPIHHYPYHAYLEGFSPYSGPNTSIFYQKEGRIHIVYEKPLKGQVVGQPGNYIGRTSGYGDVSNPENIDRIIYNRDRNHHKNREDFYPAQLIEKSINPDAIRGLEQIRIDALGGPRRHQGTSGNEINSISDKNPKRDIYLETAQQEFGKKD